MPGQPLLEPGRAPTRLLLLASGEVSPSDASVPLAREILDFEGAGAALGEGETLGENALRGGARRLGRGPEDHRDPRDPARCLRRPGAGERQLPVQHPGPLAPAPGRGRGAGARSCGGSWIAGDETAARAAMLADTVTEAFRERTLAVEAARESMLHADLAHRIREALKAQGMAIDRLHLVAPGTLPRTTSGKLQRGQVRAMLQAR